MMMRRLWYRDTIRISPAKDVIIGAIWVLLLKHSEVSNFTGNINKKPLKANAKLPTGEHYH